MKPIIQKTSNYVEISVPISKSLADLTRWILFIKDVLNAILPEKVTLITLSPQKYSLGYELDNVVKKKIERNAFLINENLTKSIKLLELISQSEEFERGLLLISSGNIAWSDCIETINDLPQSRCELVFLQADGSILRWINLSVDDRDIEEMFHNCMRLWDSYTV